MYLLLNIFNLKPAFAKFTDSISASVASAIRACCLVGAFLLIGGVNAQDTIVPDCQLANTLWVALGGAVSSAPDIYLCCSSDLYIVCDDNGDATIINWASKGFTATISSDFRMSLLF